MQELIEERFRDPHRKEQNSVHAVPLNIVPQRLFHLIRMIDPDEQKITIEFAEFRLDALENLHEKKGGKKRDDRHERIRPFARKSTRVRMGPIA